MALVLTTGLALAANAQTATSSGIKDVDFSNFSYRAQFGDPTNQKKIKLANGKFEDGGGYDAGGTLYELFGQPAYGDLNGDKSDDAVIEIKLSAPPSLRAFEVQAFTFQSGAAKMLARIDSDRVTKDYVKYHPKGMIHYAGTNPATVQNGHIIVEALTDGSFACPAHTSVFDYKLIGGKFVLSGKPINKPFKCSE